MNKYRLRLMMEKKKKNGKYFTLNESSCFNTCFNLRLRTRAFDDDNRFDDDNWLVCKFGSRGKRTNNIVYARAHARGRKQVRRY